jgi:hypothetical protein
MAWDTRSSHLFARPAIDWLPIPLGRRGAVVAVGGRPQFVDRRSDEPFAVEIDNWRLV